MILTVERLGHHGDGVAQGIFVPGALPGETVEGTPSGERLENVRIVTPSPLRVKPPCPHARACGGCVVQHAADGFVAEWKRGIVVQALAAQGLEAEVRAEVLTSPPRSRRRATFAGRRGKAGVTLGFHMRGSATVLPVPDCQLVHPDLTAARPALEALTAMGGARGAELALTVTRSLTGLDVVVRGGKPLDAALRMDLARLVETHGLARLTWEDETVALRVEPMVQLGAGRVPLPPGAFLQATDQGEAALVQAVQQAVGPARRVADLFCGIGTFSFPLAETAEVLAFEADATMIRALDRGARGATGVKRITAEARDLFRRPLEPDETRGLDAVILDPPRAGAEAQCARLAVSKVPVIAMVSCNPATFARDARRLVAGGYRLGWVQVVDQFRWSAHVELVARFSR